MVRWLISVLVTLGANAIGLLVADLVLDDFNINAASFILALIIFTVVEMIAHPILVRMSLNKAQFLRGGTALVATLIGLIVTDLVSDGLSIAGFSTWLLSTLIVWIAGMLAGLILGAVFLKNRKEERAA